LSHQLASILLPSNRPEIQPPPRQTKNVASEPDRKVDTFERTLDKQLERQQPVEDAAESQPVDKTSTTPEEPASKDVLDNKDTISFEEIANTDVAETAKAPDEDTIPNETLIASPIAVNAPAVSTRFDAPGLTQTLNNQPGLNNPPANPLAGETLPPTPPKEGVAGKAIEQKPAGLIQTSDLFTRELAGLNVESGSKQIAEEARAQLANQSEGARDNKNSGSLLQKAITEIAGLQNAPQNGLANGTPNAAANANLLATTGNGGATAQISQSIDELSLTPQNAFGTSTKMGTAIQTNQSAQTAINSLAVQITRQANLGVNRFQIRMDPPELGRIDVKLEFGRDGRMTANLSVERAETLDLLLRDARALERALAGSGLNTDKDSLNFSLKDQSANEFADFKRDAEAGSDQARTSDDDADLISPLDNTIAAYRSLISSTAVDIRI